MIVNNHNLNGKVRHISRSYISVVKQYIGFNIFTRTHTPHEASVFARIKGYKNIPVCSTVWTLCNINSTIDISNDDYLEVSYSRRVRPHSEKVCLGDMIIYMNINDVILHLTFVSKIESDRTGDLVYVSFKFGPNGAVGEHLIDDIHYGESVKYIVIDVTDKEKSIYFDPNDRKQIVRLPKPPKGYIGI